MLLILLHCQNYHYYCCCYSFYYHNTNSAITVTTSFTVTARALLTLHTISVIKKVKNVPFQTYDFGLTQNLNECEKKSKYT